MERCTPVECTDLPNTVLAVPYSLFFMVIYYTSVMKGVKRVLGKNVKLSL
jgi:hypothetical protein